MGTSEISDDLSDWEEIQYPHSNQPSRSPSPSEPGQHVSLEMEIRENFYDGASSAFPPSEHQDLPLVPEPPLPDSKTDPPCQHQTKTDSKLSIIFSEVEAKICKMRWVFTSFSRSPRCPSFVPATAAVAVAIFACVKILQWRNRLLLLIRQKDQTISQLLNQIAHMNEILSARRRVPVLRIN